jgi:hypothetical protein
VTRQTFRYRLSTLPPCLRRTRTFTGNPQSGWLILGQSSGPERGTKRRLVRDRET